MSFFYSAIPDKLSGIDILDELMRSYRKLRLLWQQNE